MVPPSYPVSKANAVSQKVRFAGGGGTGEGWAKGEEAVVVVGLRETRVRGWGSGGRGGSGRSGRGGCG